MNFRSYQTVFTIGLQNTFVYRWNYFLRALFGLIPLAGTVFLWHAIFREPGGRGFGGYNYGSMIYYYLLTILVSNLVSRQRMISRSRPIFAKVRLTHF